MDQYPTVPPPQVVSGGQTGLYIVIFLLLSFTAAIGVMYFRTQSANSLSEEKLKSLRAKFEKLQSEKESDEAELEAKVRTREEKIQRLQELQSKKEAQQAAVTAELKDQLKARESQIDKLETKVNYELKAAAKSVEEANALRKKAQDAVKDANERLKEAEAAREKAEASGKEKDKKMAEEMKRVADKAAADVAAAKKRAAEESEKARFEAKKALTLKASLDKANSQLVTIQKKVAVTELVSAGKAIRGSAAAVAANKNTKPVVGKCSTRSMPAVLPGQTRGQYTKMLYDTCGTNFVRMNKTYIQIYYARNKKKGTKKKSSPSSKRTQEAAERAKEAAERAKEAIERAKKAAARKRSNQSTMSWIKSTMEKNAKRSKKRGYSHPPAPTYNYNKYSRRPPPPLPPPLPTKSESWWGSSKKSPTKASSPSVLKSAVNAYFSYHDFTDPSLKVTRSDKRLKVDIVKIGELRGYNVYSWTWNFAAKLLYGLTGKEIGVLAQDLPADVVDKDKYGYLFIRPDTWVTELQNEINKTFKKNF